MGEDNSVHGRIFGLADELKDKALANENVREAVEWVVPHIVDKGVTMATGKEGLGKISMIATKAVVRDAAEVATFVAVGTAMTVAAPFIGIGAVIYSLFSKDE